LLTNAGAFFHLSARNSVVNDPQQAEPVASPDPVDRIKSYQAQNGIDATGNLDSKTLSTMAKGSFGQNIASHLQ